MPRGKIDTKTRLMDVAEKLFADHGFDGVSLRRITQAAGVQLAMVNYHFGTKQGLFEAVFARRIEVLGAERLQLLEAIEAAAGDGPLPLEDVVAAFVGPFYRFTAKGGRGWKNYARLVAQAANSRAMTRTGLGHLFDSVARRFIAAFHRAVPDRSEEEVVWSFHFLLGSMLYMFAETGRIENLTDGKYRSGDLDAQYAHVVPFLAAGFRACRAREEETVKKTQRKKVRV